MRAVTGMSKTGQDTQLFGLRHLFTKSAQPIFTISTIQIQNCTYCKWNTMNRNSGPKEGEESNATDGRKRKELLRKRRWKQSGNNWMKQMNPEVKREQSCVWWREDGGKVKLTCSKALETDNDAGVREERAGWWRQVSSWRNKRTIFFLKQILAGAQRESGKIRYETDWKAQRTVTSTPAKPLCFND